MAKKQELIAEARACICNGLAAYVEAFDLLPQEEVNEDFFEAIEDMLKIAESAVPMLQVLYELAKKDNPDLTFSEFLAEFMKNK